MKSALIVFTFCLSHLIFAQNEDSLMFVIDQVEISSLNTRDASRAYFNNVSDLSIGIQNRKMEIVAEFGFKSAEHDSILQLEETINSFLLLKMREYLSLYPYPKRLTGDTIRSEENNEILYIGLDAIASTTVIRVFINATGNPEEIDMKRLYFPRFYQAYKRGDIYSGALWNLLHGLYRQVKHEEYLNLELTEGEQIEMMIDKLQLKRKE